MILPLLSRFDRRDEVSEADTWLARFSRDLKQPAFDAWLPKQFQPLQILELTKVPYVTRFSFGEPLPVLTHNLTDPELPNFYLQNAARLLGTDFREAAQIIDPSAVLPQDTATQINALIQRAPIDEIQLHSLLRQAEQEIGDGARLGSLLNNIGLALQKQARFATAEPFFRRAHAIDEKSYGPEHPNVAIRLNNLGQLLQATNRLEEAEPLIRRALAINERSYGPEHPNVAIGLNNLAQLLQATNRLEEAEALMRRALAITEKSYGPEHPKVAIRLNNLAQLLQDTNRLEEAEPLMRRTVFIFAKFTRSTGHLHPHLKTALGNYRGILEAMSLGEEEIARRIAEVGKEVGLDEESYHALLAELSK
jgi:tetratricopeptide (TPR) repeat protein